ncbi:HypC/HybG/HupF family hydrogenase formation chaperone [candidate division WOR-3 bacterium]|uniref:HypC/HybG/HupF family hydrogenase formation chaperone n=1 Tax=candidate division WOR-3 bacterium TaxID=2052148 RepID=A0A660SFD5_UNCW3|nr:MAG: HypC/HybG/HupF family hydrogenase formation chaperone [candidate division WOR-3 bacterium]
MCLAVPAKLIEREGNQGIIEVMGVRREVYLNLTPEARIGDWLLVHAGFAIQIISEDDALETLKIFDELYNN